MRRGCLLSVVIILGLCVVACGLAYFFGLPRIQDAIADEFEDAVSTEVARQIPSSAGQPATPGTYTITEIALLERLREEAENGNIDDVVMSISPAGLELGFDSSGQKVVYSGGVAAVNGELVLIDFESNNGALEFILPADKLARAIENAVNNYLAENNLRLASIELREGEMELVTEAIS